MTYRNEKQTRLYVRSVLASLDLRTQIEDNLFGLNKSCHDARPAARWSTAGSLDLIRYKLAIFLKIQSSIQIKTSLKF